MSRNLYLGTDLRPVINAKNQTELSEAIMRSYSEIQATDYSTRAQALAIEIADKKPDLIGLQEVVLIRGQALKNPAATIEFDYLKILLNELAKLGQNYDTVAVSNGFIWKYHAFCLKGSSCRDLRLTDREVILTRNDPETSDLKLSNVQERNFYQ